MASSNTQGVVQAESKGNHWLICVAGSSPAVVTETLYCLKDRENFPNKVVIFTTLHGQEAIQEKGMIDQVANLCRDYDLPLLKEEQIELRIVTGTQGEPLWDIRTSEEQEAMANFLTQEIRSITHPQGKGAKRPDSIHASLAGGRKSMSFYMGNIFSFFASPQDELSHVLVDEDYEVPGFWYPTRESKPFEKKNWKTGEIKQLDAKDAQLELSSIPFVRLTKSLVSTDSPAFHQLSYRELVDIYQVTMDPSQIQLTFDLKNLRVDLNGRVLPIKQLDTYLFYYLVAKDTYEGRLSYQKPEEGADTKSLMKDFWKLMADVVGESEDDFQKLLNSDGDEWADIVKGWIDNIFKTENESMKVNNFDPFNPLRTKKDVVIGHGSGDKAERQKMQQGVKFFASLRDGSAISSGALSRITSTNEGGIMWALQQTESLATAKFCRVATVKKEDGVLVATKGSLGNKPLGLLLPPEQIHFIS